MVYARYTGSKRASSSRRSAGELSAGKKQREYGIRDLRPSRQLEGIAEIKLQGSVEFIGFHGAWQISSVIQRRSIIARSTAYAFYTTDGKNAIFYQYVIISADKDERHSLYVISSLLLVHIPFIEPSRRYYTGITQIMENAMINDMRSRAKYL